MIQQIVSGGGGGKEEEEVEDEDEDEVEVGNGTSRMRTFGWGWGRGKEGPQYSWLGRWERANPQWKQDIKVRGCGRDTGQRGLRGQTRPGTRACRGQSRAGPAAPRFRHRRRGRDGVLKPRVRPLVATLGFQHQVTLRVE